MLVVDGRVAAMIGGLERAGWSFNAANMSVVDEVEAVVEGTGAWLELSI